MRQSSIEAHENIKPKKETHYQEILKAMSRINRPEISKIISTYCNNLIYHAVARRLNEMERKGIVKVIGRKAEVKNKPMLWVLTKNVS